MPLANALLLLWLILCFDLRYMGSRQKTENNAR